MSGLAVRPEVQRNADPENLLKLLRIHLDQSFELLRGEQRCAVLFSGGVDSALAAHMTSQICDDTLLITSRCKDSHDERVAPRAADVMGLNLIEVQIDSESLWNVLPTVVHTIKTPKRMDVEISIPFFFAAQEAQRRGYPIIVSGQGPDELFAGYARYERLLRSEGTEKVEEALWADVFITDEANIQRDTRVIKYHGLTPFFPFLDQEFVKTALTIPAALNINPNKTPSRKLVFRELAMKLGVPEEVAMTPKRATQFSSGTSKMLVKSLREHVKEMRELSKKELQLAIQKFLDEMKLQEPRANHQ